MDDEVEQDDYEASLEAFHRARVERLRSPEGWLALVAKAFLVPGQPLTVGHAASCDVVLPTGPDRIATVRLEAGAIHADIAPGVATLADAPVSGERILRTDASGPSDRLLVGTMRLDVMQRGDVFALRVRDPAAPARVGLGTIDRYPVDRGWRVSARFDAAAEPTREWIDFGSGIADEMVSPGVVHFERGPHRATLRVLYEDSSRRRLYLLFRDATSGHGSYPLGRFAYAPLPEHGRVELDFNKALLPGCAFNDLATCPIPSRENTLPFPIEAGERTYTPPG